MILKERRREESLLTIDRIIIGHPSSTVVLARAFTRSREHGQLLEMPMTRFCLEHAEAIYHYTLQFLILTTWGRFNCIKAAMLPKKRNKFNDRELSHKRWLYVTRSLKHDKQSQSILPPLQLAVKHKTNLPRYMIMRGPDQYHAVAFPGICTSGSQCQHRQTQYTSNT